MKKIYVLITFLMNLFSGMTYGQSQWRFHVAFEDGTGQRDTVWLIYDSSATSGVDTSLGEGHTPLDHSRFNVWLFNQASDTTKTKAISFSAFPNHELISIDAINFTYPLIIRWDTSLFRSPILPIDTPSNRFINVAEIVNDYFWSINNDPPLQAYNMLMTDSVLAPQFNFGSRSQFPMSVLFWNNALNTIEEADTFIRVFPNPGSYILILDSPTPIQNIYIINSSNSIASSYKKVYRNSIEINVNELPSGLYTIYIQLASNMIKRLKYIKY